MNRKELLLEIGKLQKQKCDLDAEARKALMYCDSYKFQMLQLERCKLEADLFELEQQLKYLEGVNGYEK